MTALPALIPIFQAVDASGASLPFALLYTYAAGTTTPLATYQDAAGTIPNTNPVQCDANGLAVVYLPVGVAYKFMLTDQYGNPQPKYPQDNIQSGATGATGAPGSTWRTGAGVPSNSVGIDGDFYLNTTNGDVYKRATGAYGVVMNITGPAGSAVNKILNGSFYLGLSPWVTSGTDAPTLGTGSTALLGAAQLDAAQNTGVSVTKLGSVSQSFSIGTPVGTQILTYNTACYLESAAAFVSNTGYVKAYVYSALTGVETLVNTTAMIAVSSTPSWGPVSVDITAQLPSAGDYGVRFEIQAICNNTGGTAGTKGTITAVDDVKLVISTGGTVGATGPQGPAGPAVGTGGAQGSSAGILFTGYTNVSGASILLCGMGSAMRYTPTTSKRIYIAVSAILSSTALNGTSAFTLCYGTGANPTVGTVAPGTGAWIDSVSGASGPQAGFKAYAANAFAPGTVIYVLSGLTVGTSYWFDLALVGNGTGNASVSNINYTIFEM